MRKLNGRTVLVTGGNSGIGVANGEAFAAQGARVVLHFLTAAMSSQLMSVIRCSVVHRRMPSQPT